MLTASFPTAPFAASFSGGSASSPPRQERFRATVWLATTTEKRSTWREERQHQRPAPRVSPHSMGILCGRVHEDPFCVPYAIGSPEASYDRSLFQRQPPLTMSSLGFSPYNYSRRNWETDQFC
ncbi:hypothetical protein VNO78_34952 [Psophocarpus tetragonolobus]|uniref:Uncharacterized protein n=1 Tax=Psophocarpus tetragonolobus TaxID=3891 RepID=A0AAN9RH32_PSOTE